MCKILMMAGIKPAISKKLLWDFMIAAAPFMNANDRDGLGYVGQSTEHGLWGERWLRPEDAWKYRKAWSEDDELVASRHKGVLVAEPRFEEIGTAAPNTTHAVIYHSRMATCDKGLHNVHPFVRDDTALVHNGVIRNDYQLKKITSTCDSECILNAYVDQDISNKPDDIQKLSDALEGYYGCALLTKDNQGRQYLDIFRSPSANLYAYYVRELDTIVFCTSSEIIREACKIMKFTYGALFKVQDDTFLRLDAVTGEVIKMIKFKSNTSYTNYASRYNNPGYWGEEYAGVNRPGNRGHGHGATYPNDKEVVTPSAEVKTEVAVSEKKSSITSLTVVKGMKETCQTGSNSEGDGTECPSDDPFFYRGEGYPH